MRYSRQVDDALEDINLDEDANESVEFDVTILKPNQKSTEMRSSESKSLQNSTEDSTEGDLGQLGAFDSFGAGTSSNSLSYNSVDGPEGKYS